MSRVKVAVLISGGGTNLQSLIDSSEKGYFSSEIKLVISNRPDAYGLTRAKNHHIKTAVLDRATYPEGKDRDLKLLEMLQQEEIDLVVLAGYLAIIPQKIIEKYRNRIINIHPSLLPSFGGKGFYGRKVHEEVIKRGVKITGATVHFVNEETDGGPIIFQEAVKVDFDDTVDTIQEKVLAIEHQLLPRAVKLYEEGLLVVIDDRVKI
ncbi:phosphoribosylglycinamide formyltransferase [Alkaliphilus hydrothermalis]|uniref:Phosphoribosylglycinamide formyltransferase n=1 Tax=Alkaliphilus hydrothermalis TaxID=1482730 RepID=A0ABS2NSU0_9FIRM|nr:phosphoribosylglycinamide formyltransferase [Alkaliphilus hydrothermalis]MBM7616020.1 phosphoribosylglycinamide formyltransferase-1 [Alkaliphilus hydrothermalis]